VKKVPMNVGTFFCYVYWQKSMGTPQGCVKLNFYIAKRRELCCKEGERNAQSFFAVHNVVGGAGFECVRR